MMVEAEATEERRSELVAGGATAPTEEIVAAGPGGGQAVHPDAVSRPRRSWPRVAAKPTAEFPTFLDYGDDVFTAVEARGRRASWPRR